VAEMRGLLLAQRYFPRSEYRINKSSFLPSSLD
jgi:hypothetical protein